MLINSLKLLVEKRRRRRVGIKIANSYRRLPQTEEELAGLELATRALIEEESDFWVQPGDRSASIAFRADSL